MSGLVKRTMKKIFIVLLSFGILVIISGCSGQSADKVRYDMEKLVYMADKLAERLDIQPQLTTSSDSLALKTAFENILDFYRKNRDNPLFEGNEQALTEMNRMAVRTQLRLAQYYSGRREADSVIAAYRRIGTEIPADPTDVAGATLALALTFRALNAFDSTFALYDRILADFYPPVDKFGVVNADVVAIPIDKLKIAQAIEDKQRADRFAREALEYYDRLQRDFPDNGAVRRRAMVNASRIYTMTQQWDMAVGQLRQIKDSTGQIDIASEVLIANIYNGPKKDPDEAISLYRQIIDREPDSSIIGSSMLQLGMALCGQEAYDDGRQVLAELKRKFAAFPPLVSKAQFYYAQSFEVQGRWDRALSEYQWLMENYPYSEDAFWAARRIPEHFEADKNREMADLWYDRAVGFYQKAADVKKGQSIEIAAYTYMSEIYRLTKQWEKALEILDRIHALSPRTRLAAKALYNSAAVAYNELDDSLRAQEYLNRLTREFGTTDSTEIYEDEKTDLNLESLE